MLIVSPMVDYNCDQINSISGRVRSVFVGYVVAEKEAIVIWLGCCWIGPPLFCQLFTSLSSLAQYIAYLEEYLLFRLSFRIM